jgi:hypothetical protein
MGDTRNALKLWSEHLKGRENLDGDGGIILKWLLKEYGVRMLTVFI